MLLKMLLEEFLTLMMWAGLPRGVGNGGKISGMHGAYKAARTSDGRRIVSCKVIYGSQVIAGFSAGETSLSPRCLMLSALLHSCWLAGLSAPLIDCLPPALYLIMVSRSGRSGRRQAKFTGSTSLQNTGGGRESAEWLVLFKDKAPTGALKTIFQKQNKTSVTSNFGKKDDLIHCDCQSNRTLISKHRKRQSKGVFLPLQQMLKNTFKVRFSTFVHDKQEKL